MLELKMPIYLHGLALQFYRGIGPDMQKLAPFKEFNFFIGSNNAGKSTVLSFINKFLPHKHEKKSTFDPLENYTGAVTGSPTMAIGVPVQECFEAVLAKPTNGIPNQVVQSYIHKISSALGDKEIVWIKDKIPLSRKFAFLKDTQASSFREVLDHQEWYQTWRNLTGQNGGGIDQHWVPETLSLFLNSQELSFPQVNLIPAIRQVGPKAESFSDFSGRGLIDRLAEIQSPDHDKRHERDLFDRINHFLQTVTGRVNAKIDIPHNREHILVHMDNKVLPLALLGTGIHEVIMIAAFCTLSQRQIVCIEEPEIHLHPLLQRKLITYLKQNTDNQYFIATHSASFIDTPDAAIFHVTNDGAQTFIRETVLRSERVAICVDLGVRASDIVQTNCVIWVEGPSDRIYISHWIKAIAEDLVEGIHYSIMFYGGRLLNHLSANDNEVTEFIGLRSLNQNLAIVMDSDKPNAHASINATKRRLADEFQKGTGIAWVTKGREIENYVNHETLQRAVKQAHPETYVKPCAGGTYDHALYYRRVKRRSAKGKTKDDGIEKGVDKIKVAKIICEQTANLEVLDLRKRINEIVNLIREANKT